MMCVVTALMSEAKPIIDFFNLSKCDDPNFLIYTNKKITLIISKIGKLNSAIATTYLLSRDFCTQKDTIINIGICATAYKSHQIGDLFEVKKIIDKSSSKVLHLKHQLPHLQQATITCCDKVQNNPKNFQNTLIDMESFGFYKATQKFSNSKNIHLIKVVSDKISDTILSPQEVYALISPHLNSLKKILF